MVNISKHEVIKLWNGIIIQSVYGKFVAIVDSGGLGTIELISKDGNKIIIQGYNYTLNQLIDIIEKYEYFFLPLEFVNELFTDYQYHEQRCWHYPQIDYMYKDYHNSNFMEISMFLSTLM